MADKGTKKYLIEHPYYRPKVGYFEPGSVVEIPADEEPSRTWVEVELDAKGTPVPVGKAAAGAAAAVSSAAASSASSASSSPPTPSEPAKTDPKAKGPKRDFDRDL